MKYQDTPLLFSRYKHTPATDVLGPIMCTSLSIIALAVPRKGQSIRTLGRVNLMEIHVRL